MADLTRKIRRGKKDDGCEGYNNRADGISSSYRNFFIMASTYNRKKKRKIINEDQGTRKELEQDVELIEKKNDAIQ